MRSNRPVATSLTACCLGLACALPAGCRHGRQQKPPPKWLDRTPPQRYLERALTDEDADARRIALVRVAGSKVAARDDGFKALSLIARTDPGPQVRCAAIRALGQVGDARSADPLLMILNAAQHRDDVRSPEPEVRWDAAAVLVALASEKIPTDPQRAQMQRTFVRLLANDPFREVRIAAAHGLRFCKDRAALDGLVAALGDEDFGVAYEARRSLVQMTGMDHAFSREKWLAWLGKAEDPFAAAASQPAKEPSWLEQIIQSMRRKPEQPEPTTDAGNGQGTTDQPGGPTTSAPAGQP